MAGFLFSLIVVASFALATQARTLFHDDKTPKPLTFTSTNMNLGWSGNSGMQTSVSGRGQTTGGSLSLGATSTGSAFTGSNGVCVEAVVNALQQICKGDNALHLVTSSALVCANTFSEAYFKTNANVAASGRASGCAKARVDTSSYSQSFATALTDAATKHYGECNLLVNEQSISTSVSQSLNAYAGAISRACATSKGASAAAKTAAVGYLFGTVNSYAAGIADVVAKACSGCQSKCKCKGPSDSPAAGYSSFLAELSSNSALVNAINSAGVKYCDGKRKGAVEVDLESNLVALTEVIHELYLVFNANSETQGRGSVGCSEVFADVEVRVQAIVEVIVNSWASSKYGTCASVEAGAFSKVFVDSIFDIVTQINERVCARNGGSESLSIVVDKVVTEDKPLAEAWHDAYISVFTACPCA